jgi:hypothetical protein
MTRIRIVLGALEVEYEGEQSFIEESLLDLTKSLLALQGAVLPANVHAAGPSPGTTAVVPDMTTNTVAQIMSAKTGSDLVLAAIARVNIVKGSPTVPRAEILDEMKQATTYYKETYASNLSAYLDTLVKSKKVNLVARATYALAASERGRLEAAIANGL